MVVKTLICAKGEVEFVPNPINIYGFEVIDYDHILFGTEEGLYCGYLQKDEFVRITDKRVSEIRLLQELDLIFIVSGRGKLENLFIRFLNVSLLKGRTVKVYPIEASITGTFEQDGPKIEESRGCTTLCCMKQVFNCI